jgi:hypothetical protein
MDERAIGPSDKRANLDDCCAVEWLKFRGFRVGRARAGKNFVFLLTAFRRMRQKIGVIRRETICHGVRKNAAKAGH